MKKAGKNLFLLVLIIAALLLFAELMLRMLGVPSDMPYWEKTDAQSDTYLLSPGQSYSGGWSSQLSYDVKINSLGLRDEEKDYEHGIRVLVLGDEPTFGAGVSPEQTYVKELESFLRAYWGKRDVDVINGGIPLSSVREQRVLLNKVFSKTVPSAVILQCSANDVSDMGSDRFLYYFREFSKPVPVWLRDRSVYTQFVKSRLKLLSFLRKQDLTALRQPQDAPGWMYQTQLSQAAKVKWKDYVKELQLLEEFTRKRKVKLIIVSIPSAEQVNDRTMAPMPQKMLEEFAQSYKLDFVDTLEFFRDRKYKYNKEDFYKGQGLLKPEAHDALAQMLFDELLGVIKNL